MNKINLAILGLGRIGKIHAENIISLNECNLKIIIDPISDFDNNFTELGVKQSKHFDDLLNESDIDGVIICSPSKYHVSQIKSLSDLTKNIFCEKPLGLSIEEILDVKSLVTKKSLNLHIGFNRRYDPDFSELKRHILNNEIGDLHMIKITSRDPAPPPISYIKKSGGIFLDMTIHDFDMARFIVEKEIDEVYAKGANLFDKSIEEVGDIDTAVVILKYTDSSIAVIDNSRNAAYGYDQRIEVFGSKGMIQGNNILNDNHNLYTKKGITSSLPLDFFLQRYFEAYKIEINNFIDTVINNKSVSVSGKDGLKSLQIGMAAKISLQENRPIKISELYTFE